MANKQKPGGSSRPVINQEAEFGSYQAQQVFKRSYAVTSRSFYVLSVVQRALTSEEIVVQVEEVIDGLLDEMNTRFTDEIDRLIKLCNDSGIDPQPNFNKPQTIQVEIASPRAGRFLGQIKQLDHVIGLIALLWLSGVRNDSQYAAECYLWQRNLTRLSNRIREITNRAINAANQARQEREMPGRDQLAESEPDIGDLPDDTIKRVVGTAVTEEEVVEQEDDMPAEKPAKPKAKKTIRKITADKTAKDTPDADGETQSDTPSEPETETSGVD